MPRWKPYAVTDDVTGEDIDELRRVIDEATCEKPIQELLEKRRRLLALTAARDRRGTASRRSTSAVSMSLTSY